MCKRERCVRETDSVRFAPPAPVRCFKCACVRVVYVCDCIIAHQHVCTHVLLRQHVGLAQHLHGVHVAGAALLDEPNLPEVAAADDRLGVEVSRRDAQTPHQVVHGGDCEHQHTRYV